MMKNTYETVEVTIIVLGNEDIVRTSGDNFGDDIFPMDQAIFE